MGNIGTQLSLTNNANNNTNNNTSVRLTHQLMTTTATPATTRTKGGSANTHTHTHYPTIFTTTPSISKKARRGGGCHGGTENSVPKP